MNKFYLFIWIIWLKKLIISSVLLTTFLSLAITLSIFFFKSSLNFDENILDALFDIFLFWFAFSSNFTILIALFINLKYIFNRCENNYMFKLLECNSKEFIEVIGYGDLVKVFRKWFMHLIWIVSSFVILSLFVANIFFDYQNLFDWFSIYYLYGFMSLAGYLSFIVMGSRCKKIKIIRC
ncbi:MAG: hypothetical protein JXQ66_04775 [Campylobacterales bacterium]|nr:hypothetical protein [Campylobacterales bacterium]